MKDKTTKEKVFEYLSDDIQTSYENNKQSETELAKKMEVLQNIDDYIRGPFMKKLNSLGLELNAVLPFGSTTTNLGTPGGDLDVVIAVKETEKRLKTHGKVKKSKTNGESYVVRPRRSNSVLFPLFKKLSEGDMICDFESIEHISSASVPLIAGIFKGVELDISVRVNQYTPPAYIVGKMIQGYGQFDERFDPLCAYVKKWFKHLAKSCGSEKEKRAVKRYLPSSSTSTLLVIHFLQYKGIIPNLYETHNQLCNEFLVTWGMIKHWETNQFKIPKKDVLEWVVHNQKHSDTNLGKLFYQFLSYYTEKVILREHVLDMENGKTIRKALFCEEEEEKTALVIKTVDTEMNPGKNVEHVAEFEEILRLAHYALETCETPNQSVSRIMNMRVRFKKQGKVGIVNKKVFTLLSA